MPRTRKPKRPATAERARPARVPQIPRLTFAAWVRKWRLGPGMNDQHPDILDMLSDFEHVAPDVGTEVRALHAEGLYSGFDGRVGQGWIPLLDRMVADLVALGWDRDLQQVKSKFWTLRVHVGRSTKAMDARIRAAQKEALRTCCECGCKVTARRRVADVSVPGYCVSCLAKSLRGGGESWLRRRERALRRKQ